MPKGTLFIGWGATIPGREQKGVQVFNEFLQYWGRLQQAGTIDRFEPYFLDRHGGDLLGFVLVHGEREQLDRLREQDEEFTRQMTRADLVVEHLGSVAAYTGEELNRLLGIYQQQLGELT